MRDEVAVIGLACRFPRASSPEAYWKLLLDGSDAVAEPPRGRPELEPVPWLAEQSPLARNGGFLDDIDHFEPSFFRISPREAMRMDPQQRLLLEVAWEALEDAGQPVARLAGTTTGVFVGLMNADFGRKAALDLTQMDSQLGPGSSLGIAPNRVSFALDLRGPSMAIDTLCSSSLVAVHLACQSVLADESAPLAIAGGVNLILDRAMDVFYARAGLASKDGHCRAFDASASGIVRGEGCGIVVLKRLSRALADGDRIHAVIKGSAVNQDGRSNGLTSPSRWSQEEVLTTAYRRAEVAPSRVAYVEAHGTGTLIGDPIESAALGAVMGEGRGAPCVIGSVKSNLGHLESAAGVASFIKAVLSLKHQTFVPSLHYAAANPYAKLDERKLTVSTDARPWSGELLCGVSSFGMGGTNAHVVVAAADASVPPRASHAGPRLIPLSARSIAALDELEQRTRDQLTRIDARDLAHSLGVRRDHHDLRRVLLAPEGDGLDLLRAVGARYCAGADIDWSALDAKDARFVALGTYPWQREPMTKRDTIAGQVVLAPSWQPAQQPIESRGDGEWFVTGGQAPSIAAALERAGRRLTYDAGAARNIVLCTGELSAAVALVQSHATRDVRLWLVTNGATGTSTLDAIAASSIWGFGRVVMNEMPRLRCTLVDVDGVSESLLTRELLADDSEREVVLCDGKRYVGRLEKLDVPSAPRVQLRGDAAYLITGGLGGLGLAAARRLVERGARTLILMNRRGAVTDEARRAVAELVAKGATVVVEPADVTDRSAVARVFDRHTIRGVIHAAGVMEPAMIASIDPTKIADALAAKVIGARHLHELSTSLDFFVLYSSVATQFGMSGQGVYAAANAYLDALAAYRRTNDLPAVSIAWPVIEGTGMAATASGRELAQIADRGVPSISLAAATDALERALAGGFPPCASVGTFELGRWARHYPHARSNARFSSFAVMLVDESPLSKVDISARSPSELEEYLARALAAVLHDENLDRTRPLTDLGIDSLTALELQETLKTDLSVDIPTDRLLATISIRDLAAELAQRLAGSVVTVTSSMRDDAQLDPSFAFDARPAAAPREIFLTGATGFLGAFVLADLLEHSTAHIHCLVRAKSERDGMRRLETTLDRYDLPALDLASRVTCLPGDLAQPRLGLDDWPDVDTIIHSGASVNFVYPYEALKGPNVDGTREILRLAADRRARLHYVSTIGVFPGGPRRPTVMEHDRPPPPDQLLLGYMRAKWVAEELVMQARERGLDVSIYRPGTIAGHVRTGAFNPDDFVCALIKGCIQLGLAPRVGAPVHLASVDYVSQALVRIALGARPADTYHLVGTHPVNWSVLVEWVRRLGYPLDDVPYAEWRAIVLERAAATGNALTPLLSLFAARETTDWLYLPDFDDTRTRRDSHLTCPAVDSALIRRYVQRFVISGYLPRPGTRQSHT